MYNLDFDNNGTQESVYFRPLNKLNSLIVHPMADLFDIRCVGYDRNVTSSFEFVNSLSNSFAN